MRPVSLGTHGHVTLVFLGETDISVPSALRVAVRKEINSLRLPLPPKLEATQKAATFGDSAAVIYLPVSIDDSFSALQRAVKAAAVSVHPETARDRKSYRAHITLARAKGGRRTSKQRYRAVNNANQELEVNSHVAFTADKVILFESTREHSDDRKLIYKELWTEPVCSTQFQGQHDETSSQQ